MKKFYMNKIKSVVALTLVMLTNVAFAQSLNVTSNGKPVNNGDVIEVAYDYEDWSMPEANYYQYHYAWYPEIEVSSAEGDTLSVTVKSEEDTDGFQICWPSMCIQVKPNEIVKVSGEIGSDPVNLQIHREINYYTEDYGEVASGVLAVKLASEVGNVDFTIKCMQSSNGVKDISTSESKAEYFTIQGIRVAEPQKGQLVIERKGGKVAKRIF